MLNIVRKAGQTLVIYPEGRNGGVEIKVHVVRVGGKSVELGIVAPISIRVLREEIIHQEDGSNARASPLGSMRMRNDGPPRGGRSY